MPPARPFDTRSGSLFAGFPEEDRLQRWTSAFESYVEARAANAATRRADRPWRDNSRWVYREMWDALATWCVRRDIDPSEVQPDDLEAYIASRGGSRDVSTRYAWRLLSLVDRIERHTAATAGRPSNPAARVLLGSPRYRHANTPEYEPGLDYLTSREARALIAHLTEDSVSSRTPPASAGKRMWTDVRDRTAVALQLGAGLTPGECRVLRLADVHVEGGEVRALPWKLSVPANGNHPARETPVATWAGRQVALWLRVRASLGIGGEFLFPSTHAGRQWGHTQLYQCCQSVLERAGLVSPKGGTYRLRHTFALRQLARGKSEEQVAAWLGLIELPAIERYRRVVTSPVADLV